MKKTFLTILAFILSLTASHSQTFIKYWDKTFGGNMDDHAENIVYDGNNRLILSGNSFTNINGDKTDPLCSLFINATNNWLIALDTSLNLVWQNNVGGNGREYWPSLIATANNSLTFSCGTELSDSGCDKTGNNRGSSDFWVCRIDTSGTKIWDKTLGGAVDEGQPFTIELPSGDLIISGNSDSPIGFDKSVPNFLGSRDFWSVKLDVNGNKVWDNVYGGGLEEQLFFATPCSGTSYMLAGCTESNVGFSVTDTNRGLQDFWIIKIDSGGNKIWDKRYGGSASEKCLHVLTTNDNGYLLSGYTASPQDGDVSEPPRGNLDFWIVKIDSVGNKQWDKRFGCSGLDEATWAAHSYDGGYWVLGTAGNDSCGDISEPSYGGSDYWMIKLDSMGNKVWDKRFGGSSGEDATSFIFMPDSSIILFGQSYSGSSTMKTDTSKGLLDYWLVRFKYSDNSVGINQPTNASNQISIAPNPTKGIINLKSNLTGAATLCVSNVLGEKVYVNKMFFQKQNTLDFTTLPNGMYFLQIQTGQVSNMVKFVKQ